jgi:hypothetical protein
VTRTLLDVAASASRMPEALQKGQKAGVSAAALVITREVRQRTRAATGGDMRLSGVGLRGARVGARYDVRGVENPVALVRATGPYHLLERDTRAHGIAPRKRRRTRALRFRDGTFAASVQHPGTRGRHTFEKSVDAKRDEAARAFEQKIVQSVEKGWFR